MHFTPKTEEQIAAENLWPAGDYPFTVLTGEDTTSKAGNEMIKLTIEIYNDTGGKRTLTDYLMEKVLYKLLHFCSATGMTAEYESGALTGPACVGRTGTVSIIQKHQDGFMPKNEVKDYVKVGDKTEPPKTQPAASATDDSGIPF